ncbi:MAG TPA: aquaporin [Planctomycetaceae bacterium]|nr:aquaporin [Planctomycetaceae bacterium]
MQPFIAEMIGTALLILFGNGVVANVVLTGTKGNGAGWLTIAAGWGIAVYIGAFCSAESSGAHLNPAVTIAMILVDKLPLADAVAYIAAQFIGAMIGAALVYITYRSHFNATEDTDAKLACFCTGPAIRNLPQAFVCEAIGTFALLLPIFLMASPKIAVGDGSVDESQVLGLGAIGLLPVGMLVFGIGLSLGGTTGYAINPARDLGPRIMHFLLPIKGKRDSDWQYAWVPILGPITGASAAAIFYRLFLVA